MPHYSADLLVKVPDEEQSPTTPLRFLEVRLKVHTYRESEGPRDTFRHYREWDFDSIYFEGRKITPQEAYQLYPELDSAIESADF